MKKVTKKWEMKDGTKIRICDMEDPHLLNSMWLLQTSFKQFTDSMLDCIGCDFNPFDISEYYDECDIVDIFPMYEYLEQEAIRRKLI